MLDRLVGVGAGLVPEQRRDAGQFVAGDLERRDRIGESRGFRVVRNRIDLGNAVRPR
jgi:hypothetical protein